MAKKAKEDDNFEKVKSFFLDIFLKNVVSTIKGQFDYFLGKIQGKLYQTEKGIIERLIAATILLIGFIFLFLSLAYYLIEVQNISKSLSFLIVGIILIIISVIMKFTLFRKK